ncbi:hypothetical protein Cgig2_016404 [Carnegiea gigantea]|uniref:Uncharacterized protein n=1 Tax=Carnegiea gigantea TaxID=171969 RepID=A0A9Q1Q5F6_9CARY|nr:hypothetical protein Cgig2_016404 [Carnegiea gigantea]
MSITGDHDAEMAESAAAGTGMEACISAVEEILNYKFTNRKLLEDALTHPSYTESPSYQRLEFVGDAVLGLAFANFVYLAYPTVDQGILSLLRAANISTEKLARVAVRHGLYRYVRHTTAALDLKECTARLLESCYWDWMEDQTQNPTLQWGADNVQERVMGWTKGIKMVMKKEGQHGAFCPQPKVQEFALAVQEEDETAVYGGAVKAPKVLADIVESVVAAVYVIRGLLEPIITLESLPLQPVTMLFELCQKQGKQVDIKHWRKIDKNICSIYVDGQLIATGTSDQKDIAKLNAAKEALAKLDTSVVSDIGVVCQVNEMNEIEAAKQKLHELCDKKKWPKPSYRTEKEEGPAHGRKYVCSVEIETEGVKLYMAGDEKSRVKEAENSAASFMIHSLDLINANSPTKGIDSNMVLKVLKDKFQSL